MGKEAPPEASFINTPGSSGWPRQRAGSFVRENMLGRRVQGT